ncbi:Ni/Fe-hydrogenase, b-type cytochrome subunit [Psychromarinibacter halotolerans]|uniref:Ni/Fe-hydrogenase, b-type cytochrome subunit n=1 Tax=Psychromarinibacter halotolerans TaxID=1775175 RepID=A0ABV7GUW1_9RHOB|nr:Ni/Fe-hydrogenase, b-type cytochrome subunit [Psychromarinibacter halotolerans]MDF0595060.1 Ni/Fe-hydrogenase, b-type cytochrome subunit [Psychromarinibacter halotolerans]
MNEPNIHRPNPSVEPLPTSRLAGDATSADIDSIRRRTSVYVYEAPVRLWHWINAAAIFVLVITGFFIGSPPPSMQIGEATHQFVFGYIRFAHFAAGWIMTVGFAARIYWACVGNHHSRQLFYLPLLNRHWWSELFFEVRWYLFLEREPKKYVGHNPLAQLAMFMFMTLGMSFMIVTGLALYSEGLGHDSTLYKLFGWVFTVAGNNSHYLHTYHHLGMWFIVIFMIIHIYVAVREDIMSRQSIVSTMISGHRTFKDDRPD